MRTRAFPLATSASGLVSLLFFPDPAVRSYADFAAPKAISDRAPQSLQFTSQGRVLGIRTDGFYFSNATNTLRGEFVGANPIAPVIHRQAGSLLDAGRNHD